MKTQRIAEHSLWINGRIVAYLNPVSPHGTIERAQEFKRALNFHAECKASTIRLQAERERGFVTYEKTANQKRAKLFPPLTDETAFKSPFEKIALRVAHRLENPTNARFMEGEVKFAPGSNGKVKRIKNDGKLRGSILRYTSHSDLQDIAGVIALEVVQAGEFDSPRISFSTWKRIFSHCRALFEMNRKSKRQNLFESLQELQVNDFHSELRLSQFERENFARELRQVEETERFQRDLLAKESRRLLATLHASWRADSSRRAKANFVTQLKFLRKCLKAAKGEGTGISYKVSSHKRGGKSTGAIHTAIARFRDYLSQGEKQMTMEGERAFEALCAEKFAAEMTGISA